MSTVRPNLDERVEAIQSREDFVSFVRDLAADLENEPDAWENPTLDRYLDALAAWVEDIEGWSRNTGQPLPPQPDWRLFGRALLAAKIYE